MLMRLKSPCVSSCIAIRVLLLMGSLVLVAGCSDPVPPAPPTADQSPANESPANELATSPPASDSASALAGSSAQSSPQNQPVVPVSTPAAPSGSAGSSSPGASSTTSSTTSGDPFTDSTAAAPAWSNQVTGNLPGNARRLARIDDYNATVVFSSVTPQFALIGQEVHDLDAGKVTGRIGVKLSSSLEKLALSPDGKYLARQASPDNLFEIEIHDTNSGELVHSLKYSSKPFQRIEFLQFTRYGRLIAAVWEGSGSRLLIWDVTKPQPLRDFPMSRIDGNKVAVSEDGRILAAVLEQRLEIHDLAQGERLTVLDPPPHDKPFNPMMFVTGLAFSRDGGELAGMFSLEGFRFVVWKTNGEIVVDKPLGLQIGGAYNNGRAIEWAPNGSGWLLHGNFYFDRQLDMLAWILEPPVQHNYHHPWFSEQEVVASVGDFQNRSLVAVPFPREILEQSRGALRSDAEAWLRPGDGVSLDIRVGATRFADSSSVTEALREALTKRLTAGGLVVGDGHPVRLQVQYAESQGSELHVVEGGPGPLGRPTGQRVQETVVEVKATMTRTGKADPIWKTELRRGNPHIVRSETVDDQSVRSATFRGIEYTLNSMSIPTFVPAGGDVAELPVITSLK